MLEKEIYLILGASSDVGIAYIKDLEKRKREENKVCDIIAHYASSSGKLETLKKECTQLNIRLTQADLSNKTDIFSLIKEIEEVYGSLTHIVHLAAQKFSYMRIKQFDWDVVMRDMEVQVHALAEVFKAFLPKMAKQKYGKIAVMLTSYVQGTPPKFMSNYVLVKYALLGLVKSAASEYAGKGITINAVSPNMMETKFLQNIDERTIEMTADASAMKRNITVEEVVPTLHYLLSDASAYMTGTNVNLSGGDNM